MKKHDITSEITHGNYGLERVLHDLVLADGLPITEGNTYVVIPSTDESYVQYVKDYQEIYEDGTSRIYPTVKEAYDAATTNRNDAILLSGVGSHSLTEMLTVSKNRIRFIGMGAGGRATGHASRLVMGVTTAAADIAAVKVTGVRNSFTNVKVESNNTKAESLYALVDAGEYTKWQNCSFLKLTDLGEATAADVVGGGDSTTWNNCEFGAATLRATAARPVFIIDKSLAGSNGLMDNNFNDCNFVSYTSSADRHFIELVANQDGQRYAMFRGCSFINWDIIGTGTTMTDAIHAVAGQTQLYLVFDANTICVGCTNFAQSTDNAGVYICAPVPTAATSGIAVNAA